MEPESWRDKAGLGPPPQFRIYEPPPPTREENLFATWADGRMPASELAALVGDAPDPDVAGDRLMAALGLDEIEYFPSSLDEPTARRWAYTDEWLFSSQDEDLMARQFPLLSLVQLSAQADCPKNEYCAALAEEHVRERVNDAARVSASALDAAVADMKQELEPLGDLEQWPATAHLRRVDAVKDLPLKDLEACINFASIISRCCQKDPADYVIERRSSGYYISNIDGHYTKLAASTRDSRWDVVVGWDCAVTRKWWRRREGRGIDS